MDEREEVMVIYTTNDGKSHRTATRIGHFLKPSSNNVNVTALEIPPKTQTNSNNSEPFRRWPLKVTFNGWRNPQKKWKHWVDKMHSFHKSVWKKAGIHDALLNSTYTIRRDNAVVYELVKNWCPKGNTFVLPWGEVTITLEDLMILGGYSVTGKPVFFPLNSLKQREALEKLIQARQEVTRSKAQKASHGEWLNKFMDSGSEIEHQAFLALWLSRFVFPSASLDTTISKSVLFLAVLLAEGTNIALAPPVLASIYRDLTLLRNTLINTANANESEEDECVDGSAIKIRAPFQLLQIWIWERFPTLSPKPSYIISGGRQPRFARWDKMKRVKIGNVRLVLHSCSRNFRWRPYANETVNDQYLARFYSEREMNVLVDCNLHRQFKSWARCLRVSELVGLDNCTIEGYFPHRVAKQFGMDQDIPGHVVRANGSSKVAWRNYTRPIEDKRLFVPSRLVEPSVTARYLEWWNRSMSGLKDVNVIVDERRSTSTITTKSSARKMQQKVVEELDNDDDEEEDRVPIGRRIRRTTTQTADSCVPPGFCTKCSKAAEEASCDDEDEDKLPISRLIRTTKQAGKGLSTKAGVENVVDNIEDLTKGLEAKTGEDVATGSIDEGNGVVNIDTSDDDGVEAGGSSRGNHISIFDGMVNEMIPDELELEARISKLEQVVVRVEAARGKHSGHGFCEFYKLHDQ